MPAMFRNIKIGTSTFSIQSSKVESNAFIFMNLIWTVSPQKEKKINAS